MTFDSVFQILNKPLEIKKSRFWDNFDGDALRNWWFQRVIQGSGQTFGIVDAVGEGAFYKVGTSTNRGGLSFNDIRHYDPINSVMIAMLRWVDASGNKNHVVQMTSDDVNFTTDVERSGLISSPSAPNISIATADGSSQSVTVLAKAYDTVFNTYELRLSSTKNIMNVNGVLDTTKTTDIPSSAPLQPFWGAVENEAEMRIRYLEIYNK